MIRNTSVIIPIFGKGLSPLSASLLSLTSQTLKPKEIVVIDNGSKEDVKSYLKKKYPKVKLVVLTKNMGVTGGRNAGIKSVDKNSDYLLFFDHDMVADENMLEELVRVAESDKKIGVVTPKIYYWEDKKRIWSAGTGINLWTGQVLFHGGKDVGQYEKVEEVQVAPAVMLVKKEVIKKIKGFDNKYFATYEDTDFCFRARKFGFKTFYAPGAVAYHDLSTSKKDEAKRLLDRAFWVGRNRILFMKKFGNNFLVFLFFIPLFSLYYLYMAIRERRLKDGLKFITGTFDGILS